MRRYWESASEGNPPTDVWAVVDAAGRSCLRVGPSDYYVYDPTYPGVPHYHWTQLHFPVCEIVKETKPS